MFFPPRCISFSYYSHGLRVISEAVLSWEQKYGLSFWWMDLKFYLTQDDSYIIPNKFYLSWCIICLEALSSRQDMPEIKNNISRGSKNPIWLIFNFFPKLLKRFLPVSNQGATTLSSSTRHWGFKVQEGCPGELILISKLSSNCSLSSRRNFLVTGTKIWFSLMMRLH